MKNLYLWLPVECCEKDAFDEIYWQLVVRITDTCKHRCAFLLDAFLLCVAIPFFIA